MENLDVAVQADSNSDPGTETSMIMLEIAADGLVAFYPICKSDQELETAIRRFVDILRPGVLIYHEARQ